MDLNIKFQKSSEVFLQNSEHRLFSIIIELFFYWTSRGIGPAPHGPGPRFWLMSLPHSGSISVVGSLLDAQILMKMTGYPRSNISPWSKLGWLGLFFLQWRQQNRGDEAPPWPVARWAQARPMVHHLRRGFFLRDLCDDRNPIYSLVVEKTGHGWPAATVRVRWPSMVVRVPSSVTPAPRCAPTVGGGLVLGQIHMG
jgi:hypothetical protein